MDCVCRPAYSRHGVGLTAMIRVVLADDQALVRDGIAAVLNAEVDITVVGEAQDGGCQMFCVSPLLMSERKINEHGDRGSLQAQQRGAVA